MSVSPTDLLSLADSLLKTAVTEAEWRNAVGRAYYAVYHGAKIFYETLPSPGRLPPTPSGVHETLAFQLSWPTISLNHPKYSISRELGRNLRWLSSKRVTADYYLNTSFTLADALEVFERANAMLDLLK